MTDVVRFEEIATACGRRFGVATLNAPGSLNALSLAMVRGLRVWLEQWAEDDGVVGVVLQGAGERAFCAGGDLRSLHPFLGGETPSEHIRQFFTEEYSVDYLIHRYVKPILCWGQGIVMGGGIGLMAGASHRVVTRASRLAMPEINIGLYPDVGASWFLRRVPGRVGLFLGLTGAVIDAADALFCGLADHGLAADRADVMGAIRAATWAGSPRVDRAQLSRLLEPFVDREMGESNVGRLRGEIDALVAGDDLLAIAGRLRTLQSEDAWMTGAAANFVKGCPTSAALTFELWNRARDLSLADVFRVDYLASLACSLQPDFAEGIRAVLIDKDRKPRWSPAALEDVTREHLAAHFEARFDGPHPLAALG